MPVPHTQGTWPRVGATQVRDQGHLPLGPICSAQDKVPLRAREVCQQSRELEDFTILVGLAVGCGGLTDDLFFRALFLVSGCFTVFGNFSKLGKTTAWLHLLCSWIRTQPELLRKVEKRGPGLGVSAQTRRYSEGQRTCFKMTLTQVPRKSGSRDPLGSGR